jgi:hypothetical protein
MSDETDNRLTVLEEDMKLLNRKMHSLLALCLQQGAHMQEMAKALEEALKEALVVADNKPDDMMASLASEIQRAMKSPLN